MKWINLIGCLLWLAPAALAQTESFSYQRPLIGVTDPWHRIALPNDIFGKVSSSLSDIRILGITDKQDTIEIPYLLQQAVEKTSTQAVSFSVINTSHNERGYFYTLSLPADEPINRIHLEVKQQNFDWTTSLEGSQDQQEWFTLVEDYRILSVKNDLTDYQFTTLIFPQAQYRYFRLRIGSEEKPELTAVKVLRYQTTEGEYRNYAVQTFKTQEDKQRKQTVVDIGLTLPVPVSYLKVHVADTLDYYRPFTVLYLADSFNTPQGWKYTYRTLTSGTLTSREDNTFTFGSTISQKLRLLVDNHDNQALTINRIDAKGYEYTLVARFAQAADNYFLAYGSSKTTKPHYDLAQFEDNIPSVITTLSLGEVQYLDTKEPTAASFLVNQVWLWVTLIFIIVLLGWFSLKMMRKETG